MNRFVYITIVLFVYISLKGFAQDNHNVTHRDLDRPYHSIIKTITEKDIRWYREVYAANAIHLPSITTANIHVGIDSISAGMARELETLKKNNLSLHVDFRVIERKVYGIYSVDAGYYKSIVKKGENILTMFVRKYMTVSKRQPDGVWKWYAAGDTFAPTEAFEEAVDVRTGTLQILHQSAMNLPQDKMEHQTVPPELITLYDTLIGAYNALSPSEIITNFADNALYLTFFSMPVLKGAPLIKELLDKNFTVAKQRNLQATFKIKMIHQVVYGNFAMNIMMFRADVKDNTGKHLQYITEKVLSVCEKRDGVWKITGYDVMPATPEMFEKTEVVRRTE